MALAKEGYTSAVRGTTTVKVLTDDNGYIAESQESAASTKRFQISAVNADNNLTDNTEVLNFFLTLARGITLTDSNTMSVKWEV